MTDLDTITRAKSCFTSFQELLDAKGNYRPTISIRDADCWTLARAYDAAQAARGDERRAFLGGSGPRVGTPLRFYAGNMWRSGEIEKIGPRRVLTSYVTKKAAREAKRFGYTARPCHRYFRLDNIRPRWTDATCWEVR